MPREADHETSPNQMWKVSSRLTSVPVNVNIGVLLDHCLLSCHTITA
jgi:hypothetical protein